MSERLWEFPALRQRVRIATQDGDRDVEGVTLGGLAVTPSTLRKSGTGAAFFVITHVATGRIVGARYGFDTEAEAIGAMRVLVALPIDWRTETVEFPDDFRHVLAAAVSAWGAFIVEDPLDRVEGHA